MRRRARRSPRSARSACAAEAAALVLDSLVPAFVAAMLAGANDRGPWAAAMLADRGRRPGAVLLGLAVAYAAASAIATAGALLIAPRLTPEARLLMLALALGAGGLGALWPTRAPDRMERWRAASAPSAATAALIGGLALAIGDRIAFLAFGFAARGPSPVLAALGAMLGALALAGVAVTLGEDGWRRLPLRAIGTGGGVLLILAAILVGVRALRLA